MDMREHRLSYHETVRKHGETKIHSEDCKYIKIVKRWERIFLEEGAEGLMKERRGKSYGSKNCREPKAQSGDRVLKKLSALVLAEERENGKKRK